MRDKQTKNKSFKQQPPYRNEYTDRYKISLDPPQTDAAGQR